MVTKRWLVYRIGEEFTEELHVVPEDDIEYHLLDFTKCNCGPSIIKCDDTKCAIGHRSFDMREQYESTH